MGFLALAIALTLCSPLFFIITCMEYIEQVKRIVERNLEGNYNAYNRDYAPTIEEADKHMQIHRSLQQHYRGEPFYCNTFKGLKRVLYDFTFFRIVRKQNRKATKQLNKTKKQQERMHRNAQKVRNLNLTDRMMVNKRRKHAQLNTMGGTR